MPPIRQFSMLLLLCMIATFALSQVPKDFHPTVAILESPNSEGKLDGAHVREALWYAAADLHIAPNKLPRVLVIHAALDAAQIAEIPTTAWNKSHKAAGATLTERAEDGSKLYYVWVVGKASDEMLVRGIVQILESDVGVTPEIAAVTHRVLIHMRSVIETGELQTGNALFP